MISWLKRIWHGAVDDNSLMLDHLPINLTKAAVKPQPKKIAGTTLEEAKAKYRKPFKSYEIPTPRLTPPSRDLIEMNELSARESARHTVTAIKAKK